MASRAVTAEPTIVRRPVDAVSVGLGLVVLAAGMAVVGDGSVPGAEEAVFWAINDLPDALYPVLWPVQQFGALLVGPLVAVLAAATRRYRLAVAALAVTGSKLVLERLIKAVVTRERPWTSLGADVDVRGVEARVGEAFVSGHAMLAAALAGVLAPHLRGRWRAVPWLIAALVAVGRVYVGAHNPLDVVCGAAAGVALAGCANLALGVPGPAKRWRG